MIVDVTQRDRAGEIGLEQCFFALELGMAFAMGDGDRQTRTGHALQEDRGRILDLHHGHPRLELLGAVAHEVRPRLAAGHQLVQIGKHLATVADAQGKAVLALEEGTEVLTGMAVEQDRLGPTFTGTQHVAVGEAAAGDHTLETLETDTPREDIAHVNVDRSEPGTIERSGHFGLAIDALFAQDRHLRPDATLDKGRGNILVDVEAQRDAQARVVFLEQRVELLVGAVGIVAQALNPVAGLGPLALQQTTIACEHIGALEPDSHVPVVDRLADDRHAVGQTRGAELGEHNFGIALAHLEQRTQLLVEQRRGNLRRVLHQTIEVKVEAAMPGERHLQCCRQQPAIGAIVIGQEQAVRVEALDHREECL